MVFLLQAHELLPFVPQLGRDRRRATVGAHESNRAELERRPLLDHEGDVHQVVFRVVLNVVVDVRVEVTETDIDVSEPDHVPLELDRSERMPAHLGDERHEAEGPAETDHSALRGERNAGAKLLLLEYVLAGEPEFDLADLGGGSHPAQGVLRRQRRREHEPEKCRGPARLRTHGAPAAACRPADFPRAA